MKWSNFDLLKALAWASGFVGVIAPATHWDAGTTAMVVGVAHSLGSWAQGRMGT